MIEIGIFWDIDSQQLSPEELQHFSTKVLENTALLCSCEHPVAKIVTQNPLVNESICNGFEVHNDKDVSTALLANIFLWLWDLERAKKSENLNICVILISPCTMYNNFFIDMSKRKVNVIWVNEFSKNDNNISSSVSPHSTDNLFQAIDWSNFLTLDNEYNTTNYKISNSTKNFHGLNSDYCEDESDAITTVASCDMLTSVPSSESTASTLYMRYNNMLNPNKSRHRMLSGEDDEDSLRWSNALKYPNDNHLSHETNTMGSVSSTSSDYSSLTAITSPYFAPTQTKLHRRGGSEASLISSTSDLHVIEEESTCMWQGNDNEHLSQNLQMFSNASIAFNNGQKNQSYSGSSMTGNNNSVSALLQSSGLPSSLYDMSGIALSMNDRHSMERKALSQIPSYGIQQPVDNIVFNKIDDGSLLWDQKLLYDELVAALFSYNVKNTVSSLRKIYTKQNKNFRIPNILGSLIPDIYNTNSSMRSFQEDITKCVCFLLECIQWCFGVQKGENMESFKYKMNKNIARWILKECSKKAFQSTQPATIINSALSTAYQILNTAVELEYAMELLIALNVPNAPSRLLPYISVWKVSSNPSVLHLVNDFLRDHGDLFPTLLLQQQHPLQNHSSDPNSNNFPVSKNAISSFNNSNEMDNSIFHHPSSNNMSVVSASSNGIFDVGMMSQSMMGYPVNTLVNNNNNNINQNINFNSNSERSKTISTQDIGLVSLSTNDISPSMQKSGSEDSLHQQRLKTTLSGSGTIPLNMNMYSTTQEDLNLEYKLLRLLSRSTRGELGARIPALYREEYGEPLRLRGKKLKDILVDSGKVEMVGIDGPGDKLFRFIFNSSNNHHISSQGNNSAGMSNPPPPGLSVNLNIPTNSSQSSYHTIDGYQHADMKHNNVTNSNHGLNNSLFSQLDMSHITSNNKPMHIDMTGGDTLYGSHINDNNMSNYYGNNKEMNQHDEYTYNNNNNMIHSNNNSDYYYHHQINNNN